MHRGDAIPKMLAGITPKYLPIFVPDSFKTVMDGVFCKNRYQRADHHTQNPVKGDLTELYHEIITDINKFAFYEGK